MVLDVDSLGWWALVCRGRGVGSGEGKATYKSLLYFLFNFVGNLKLLGTYNLLLIKNK